jgi:hypothetical protein
LSLHASLQKDLQHHWALRFMHIHTLQLFCSLANALC